MLFCCRCHFVLVLSLAAFWILHSFSFGVNIIFHTIFWLSWIAKTPIFVFFSMTNFVNHTRKRERKNMCCSFLVSDASQLLCERTRGSRMCQTAERKHKTKPCCEILCCQQFFLLIMTQKLICHFLKCPITWKNNSSTELPACMWQASHCQAKYINVASSLCKSKLNVPFWLLPSHHVTFLLNSKQNRRKRKENWIFFWSNLFRHPFALNELQIKSHWEENVDGWILWRNFWTEAVARSWVSMKSVCEAKVSEHFKQKRKKYLQKDLCANFVDFSCLFGKFVPLPTACFQKARFWYLCRCWKVSSCSQQEPNQFELSCHWKKDQSVCAVQVSAVKYPLSTLLLSTVLVSFRDRSYSQSWREWDSLR